VLLNKEADRTVFVLTHQYVPVLKLKVTCGRYLGIVNTL